MHTPNRRPDRSLPHPRWLDIRTPADSWSSFTRHDFDAPHQDEADRKQDIATQEAQVAFHYQHNPRKGKAE